MVAASLVTSLTSIWVAPGPCFCTVLLHAALFTGHVSTHCPQLYDARGEASRWLGTGWGEGEMTTTLTTLTIDRFM